MKLSDRGNATQGHLEKGHSRRVINVVRFKTIGRRIHLFTPGPKAVSVVRAIFGTSAYHSLKCMRVRIDQTWQNDFIFKEYSCVLFCNGRKTDHTAVIVANEGHVTKESPFVINQTWNPDLFRQVNNVTVR